MLDFLLLVLAQVVAQTIFASTSEIAKKAKSFLKRLNQSKGKK